MDRVIVVWILMAILFGLLCWWSIKNTQKYRAWMQEYEIALGKFSSLYDEDCAFELYSDGYTPQQAAETIIENNGDLPWYFKKQAD